MTSCRTTGDGCFGLYPETTACSPHMPELASADPRSSTRVPIERPAREPVRGLFDLAKPIAPSHQSISVPEAGDTAEGLRLPGLGRRRSVREEESCGSPPETSDF